MNQNRPGYMGGYLSPEARAAAAQLQRKKRRNTALFMLLVVAALAFAAGWNPPIDRQHYFSKASDYKPEKESGCVNSGKGCHGFEKEYRDFNAYHPNTSCATCHEYQGVGCIPCHKPEQHECSSCHDGTVPNVVDRVRLTDPYPKGHYRETSHTAMGTDMAVRMTAVPGGKASAACSGCHSRDLRTSHTDVPQVDGSTYGPVVGCGECHNDTRASGLDQVLKKWKKRRCEDCNKKDSYAPMHATDVATAVAGTGPLDCGDTGSGCHAVNDLHRLHADAPKDCSGSPKAGERGCHDLTLQASVPTETACGGAAACHRAYANDKLSHKNDAEVHSATNRVPASDTSYKRTACGDCHRMDPDGHSLIDEHALPTSERSRSSLDDCRNCHNAPASELAIKDKWADRNTVDSCAVCHSGGDLPEAHTGGGFNVLHTVAADSGGCAGTGPGCHPAVDLSQVGTPTVTANIHRDCLRCHDWRERGGNLAYDPDKKTCGSGRACHGLARQYDPRSAVHAGAGGRADGTDAAHHVAGAAQYADVYADAKSGLSTACGACHSMALGTEHARPNSELTTSASALTRCVACHDRDYGVAGIVKSSWSTKSTAAACAACHSRAGAKPVHSRVETVHVGTTLKPDGSISSTACATSGCHRSTDLRVLHMRTGCTTTGCHAATGDISGRRARSCGGVDPFTSCHTGDPHPSHDANATGTVNGVTYGIAENRGCFGCHFEDLQDEHAKALPEMEAPGVNSCRVCHYDPADPGSGAFSTRPDVIAAIANHDRRCVACHSSGTSHDGPDGVASPHKRTSGAAVLPQGFVWSDPLSDWHEAFTSVTGGGHNALPGSAAGATAKAFPLTAFVIDGSPYTWALPANEGTTTWLTPARYGTVASTQADHLTLTCDGCHSFGGAPAGPHGASVKVNIDPAYSQTEYANPTAGDAQFEATGTSRVVCFKCHPMQRSYDPTTGPGGNVVHSQHVRHGGAYTGTAHEVGEKCVDCHVRIPHAWRRPRLLVRTIAGADGAAVDTFPYVRSGHDGLRGVVLRSFTAPGDLTADACATGGCHNSHTAVSHPQPSDIPTAIYWP
ncbi:MAG: hypothetical protein Q7W30_00100 [Coriobacteriia bacterium]|nr:hypothetical protein [Coriobacteriia bacterium]